MKKNIDTATFSFILANKPVILPGVVAWQTLQITSESLFFFARKKE